MQKTSRRRVVTGLVIAALAVIGARSLASAQQPGGVERKVLLQQDLTIPGYEAVLIAVAIPVGGREGRHTHPGTLLGQVLEGALTLEHEGKPTMTYKGGESFSVEAGKVHEGMNKGNTPVKAIVTFIGEKGKPMTTQVR